jgi:hypothetical protein
VFVVSSEMRAWQEVAAVAANPEGVLRRLVIGSGGWFGRSRPEVREVADEYLAHAVAQGTFPQWLEQNAQARNGMSVVVGRGGSVVEQPDRVYAVLTLPPEPHTFKLVIGWRNHRRGGGGNDK